MTTALQEITQGSLLVTVSRKIPNAPLKHNVSFTGNIQRDWSKKLSKQLITMYVILQVISCMFHICCFVSSN